MGTQGVSGDLVTRALSAKRESKYIEFKSEFDVTSSGAWCEIIKDIVAMANTGGGVILIGADNKGFPTGSDLSAVLSLDPADIANKVKKYTAQDFDGFEIVPLAKGDHKLAAITVEEAGVPIVFEKPGTYVGIDSKQKRAFSQGSVYFRHGAKSETGTSADLRKAIERRLDSIRKQWVGDVKRVVTAPRGSKVQVVAADVAESTSAAATPIRIVDDPSAPAYRKLDPDKTHPFLQTQLVPVVNKQLPKGVKINRYDIQCIRAVHGIDERVDLFHKPLHGSPQYSPEFVDWLVGHHNENPGFFQDARDAYFDLRHDA